MAPRSDPAPAVGRRVALITSSFAPHLGGVETHVARVAEGLQRRGHQVEVWTVDRGQRASDASAVPIRYLPAPLPARTPAGLWRTLTDIPPAWRAWTRAHDAFRPDVLAIQCFGPNGVYALRLHRRFGTPLVVTSHGETLGDDHGAYRSALLRHSLRQALRRSAATTAPSRYVLDDLRERFGLGTGAGEVIGNGVDLAFGVVSPTVHRDPVLAAVGRLGRMKGFDLLITAFDRARLDGVRLEIIGDGPEHARLSAQITAAGLDDRVRLVGALDERAVAQRLGEASVVAVPSRSESFGIVALEAWRAGAALIMTSHGAASEFIRAGEDAIVVDPEDELALAAALRALFTDEARRLDLAVHGAERVQAFGWERVVEAYERLFQRVLRQEPQ